VRWGDEDRKGLGLGLGLRYLDALIIIDTSVIIH